MKRRPGLRAPFPWFGGKSRVAHVVWDFFGDTANYVEPFAGSLAILLNRPFEPRIETVNDLDCYLSNFWRAVQGAPAEVARWADWPVNEADLHARHKWLVKQAEFRTKMRDDPEFFDAKIAGWWVWGVAQWIGSGWCSAPNWEGRTNAARAPRGINQVGNANRPHLMRDKGVHQKAIPEKLPLLTASQGNGIGVHKRHRRIERGHEWEKRPAMARGGRGVQSSGWQQKPDISGSRGAAGRGIHATAMAEKMPKSDRGTTSRLQTEGIYEWMFMLQERLRRVRVCCGDWTRVLGRSATELIGTTAVFLDPPYSAEAGRDPSLYSMEDLDVAHKVREWALEHGDNPKLRIALCGYEGEHDMPASWTCVPWKSNGGYASSAGNNENASRERIWFSRHCLQPTLRQQHDLFSKVGGQ